MWCPYMFGIVDGEKRAEVPRHGGGEMVGVALHRSVLVRGGLVVVVVWDISEGWGAGIAPFMLEEGWGAGSAQ